MDKIIYIVIFAGLVMTLPQVIEIWGNKTASGVSLVSWATYTITSIFWVLYGIVHRDKPVIISSATGIILYLSIVLGVIVYG
ncbi:MAG: MtN3 and saliva related transmembrane protein [archaeon GW2011_AR5]|nr:MAG: MtN3 and saliva related transmembrane protein [archaeon GW2011_AR5]